MKIAKFPDFTPFDFSLKDEYNNFYRNFPPYSDLSFGNLKIWLNQYEDLRLSWLNGNIVYEFTNLLEEGVPTLTLLGSNNIDDAISDLFQYQREAHSEPGLSMIPEVVKNALNSKDFYIITEEIDYKNYILSTNNLVNLEGPKFRRFRNQISAFKRSYQDRFKVLELELSDPKEVKQIVNHIHLWDKLYTNNDPEQQESFAINTTLMHPAELNFRNLSLFIDGNIQAIILYQMLPQSDYVIVNHAKFNYVYNGCFNYLLHKLGAILKSEGIPYINYEQDLGIPGLKEHKMYLRPMSFLHLYRITPAR